MDVYFDVLQKKNILCIVNTTTLQTGEGQMEKKNWKPMQESWNNNFSTLNGHVKPPLVLHSEAEQFIAQNAHNFVWEKYRVQWNDIAKAGTDTMSDDHKAMRAEAKPIIDELVITEITAYRAANRNSGCSLLARIEHMQSEIKALRNELDDVRNVAEEALSAAEEARDSIHK